MELPVAKLCISCHLSARLNLRWDGDAVRNVYLSWNSIGDQGAKAFAKTLQVNCYLKTLDLGTFCGRMQGRMETHWHFSPHKGPTISLITACISSRPVSGGTSRSIWRSYIWRTTPYQMRQSAALIRVHLFNELTLYFIAGCFGPDQCRNGEQFHYMPEPQRQSSHHPAVSR